MLAVFKKEGKAGQISVTYEKVGQARELAWYLEEEERVEALT